MIPAHLDSTWGLLQRAFPNGVSDAEYWTVVELLYPHMADENLAIVLSEWTGRDLGIVMNDVYAAGSGVTADARAFVADRLRQAGFEEWLAEEG